MIFFLNFPRNFLTSANIKARHRGYEGETSARAIAAMTGIHGSFSP
jgi:hypothetical protein